MFGQYRITKKVIMSIALLFLPVWLLIAQRESNPPGLIQGVGSNQPPSTTPPFTNGMVYGRVSEMQNDRPVSDGMINYTGPSSGSVITGADGTYRVGNLYAGEYEFKVSKPGYVSESSRIYITSTYSSPLLDFHLYKASSAGVWGVIGTFAVIIFIGALIAVWIARLKEIPEVGEEEHQDISMLEKVLCIGAIGGLCLATWEFMHLMADQWFVSWVRADRFVNRRIIYYGVTFSISTMVLINTILGIGKFRRFGRLVNWIFLVYSIIALLSAVIIFVFDCLPEVAAGFLIAAIFIGAIWLIRKRFFTMERTQRIRVEKGRCPFCSSKVSEISMFCPHCGKSIGVKCNCGTVNKLIAIYCQECGSELRRG